MKIEIVAYGGIPGKNGNGFTARAEVSSGGESVLRGGSCERGRRVGSDGRDEDGSGNQSWWGFKQSEEDGGSSITAEGEGGRGKGWGITETEKIGLGIVTAPG